MWSTKGVFRSEGKEQAAIRSKLSKKTYFNGPDSDSGLQRETCKICVSWDRSLSFLVQFANSSSTTSTTSTTPVRWIRLHAHVSPFIDRQVESNTETARLSLVIPASCPRVHRTSLTVHASTRVSPTDTSALRLAVLNVSFPDVCTSLTGPYRSPSDRYGIPLPIAQIRFGHPPPVLSDPHLSNRLPPPHPSPSPPSLTHSRVLSFAPSSNFQSPFFFATPATCLDTSLPSNHDFRRQVLIRGRAQQFRRARGKRALAPLATEGSGGLALRQPRRHPSCHTWQGQKPHREDSQVGPLYQATQDAPR